MIAGVLDFCVRHGLADSAEFHLERAMASLGSAGIHEDLAGQDAAKDGLAGKSASPGSSLAARTALFHAVVDACVRLKNHARLISLWREFRSDWDHVAAHVAGDALWLPLGRALIDSGRLVEAERVLVDHCLPHSAGESGAAAAAAAAHCWLGTICLRTHRHRKAVEHFGEALRLNPFLVEAAEALAKYGGDKGVVGGTGCVDVDAVVSDDACQRWLLQHADGATTPECGIQTSHTANDTMSGQKKSGKDASAASTVSSSQPAVRKPVLRSAAMPISNQQNSQQNNNVHNQQSAAGISVTVPLVRDKKRTRSGDTKRSTTTATNQSQHPLQAIPQQQQHLNNEMMAAEVVIPVKRNQANTNTITNMQHRNDELVPGFTFGALRRCYRIMQLLHQYRLKDCIQLINRHDGVVPYAHWNTSWFHARLARAYFEDLEYELAARHFKRARELEQTAGVSVVRVRDMDLYSTALWHLKDQVTLSALAQEMIRAAPGAVETWSVLGNCWSLMKEHENASRCFQRAQVLAGNGYTDDTGLAIPAVPNARLPVSSAGWSGEMGSHHAGAYACNLSGSEYMANEAYEKALVNYRHAIRLDPRMYNAWFGMGVIFYKQEKWELAEFHFRTALGIHRSSTILQCYVGMVLHKMKKYEEALLYFDRAIQLNQKNPQVHYRKALCLMDLQRLEESLREFHQVILLAPRETRVYFTMGKAYQQLGRTGDALKMYLQAMEVDVKMSTHVREAIDSLHLVDGEAVNDIYRAFA